MLSAALMLLGSALPARAACPPQHAVEDNAPLAVPARTWAAAAGANEIQIINHPGSYLRYRQRLVNSKGDETRDVIETGDGTIARLILRDNRPLTADEDRTERNRLTGLMRHPNDFSKLAKEQQANKKIGIDLIQLMPDAMLYSYAPGQPQLPQYSAPQVVLDFAPNPSFHPPTLYAEGLMGLRGRVWIDARSKVVVHIEGQIFQSINWGWGVLAHIYPGGTVDLEQAAVSGPRWNMTQFREDVTVKALMVKTLKVHAEGQTSGFQALPGPISYTDGIKMLLDTPLPR
jgi:hypothetical protein